MKRSVWRHTDQHDSPSAVHEGLSCCAPTRGPGYRSFGARYGMLVVEGSGRVCGKDMG